MNCRHVPVRAILAQIVLASAFAASACTESARLDSSLCSADYPSASVSVRLKPAGIDALDKVATGSGTVTDQ